MFHLLTIFSNQWIFKNLNMHSVYFHNSITTLLKYSNNYVNAFFMHFRRELPPITKKTNQEF